MTPKKRFTFTLDPDLTEDVRQMLEEIPGANLSATVENLLHNFKEGVMPYEDFLVNQPGLSVAADLVQRMEEEKRAMQEQHEKLLADMDAVSPRRHLEDMLKASEDLLASFAPYYGSAETPTGMNETTMAAINSAVLGNPLGSQINEEVQRAILGGTIQDTLAAARSLTERVEQQEEQYRAMLKGQQERYQAMLDDQRRLAAESLTRQRGIAEYPGSALNKYSDLVYRQRERARAQESLSPEEVQKLRELLAERNEDN